MRALTGGCLCGGVRFELAPPATSMSHCHCSRCRKWHGGAVGTYVMLPREQFLLTAGRELLATYEVAGGGDRTFCTRCGSSLFYGDWETAPTVDIAAGALDGDPGVRPACHIWVRSKAAWDSITDDLPQFETWPRDATS